MLFKTKSGKTNLAINTSIYLVSDVLVKIIPFLLLPILTRSISQSEYGLVAIFNNIIEITIVLTLFGANLFLRVEYFKDNYELKETIRALIGNSFLIFIVLTLIFFALAFIDYEYDILGLNYWLLTIPFIAFVRSIISVFISKFQCDESPLSVARLNLLQSLTVAVFILTLLSFGMGTAAVFGGTSAALLFILLLIIFNNKVNFKSSIVNNKICKSAFKFGCGIFPYSVSWWIRTAADTFIIFSFLSASDLGEYTIIVKVSSILVVFVSALNHAIAPRILQNFSNKQQVQSIKIIFISILLVSFISLCMYLFQDFLFAIIAPASYSFSSDVFSILLLALIFKASSDFISNYFYFFNKSKFLSLITFIGSMLHLVICFLFISEYGIALVAYSTLFTFFGVLIAQLLYLNFNFKYLT